MRYLIPLISCWLLFLPGQAWAIPTTVPPTLVEAWLAWQEERETPFNWAYSTVLRDTEAAAISARQQRLKSEIALLQPTLIEAGERLAAAGLAQWQHSLKASSPLPARSPAPLGLLDLISDLRRNPPMHQISLLGHCRVPAWVEAWTLSGVERVPWQTGMTVDTLLRHLPPTAARGIDRVVIVTPPGQHASIGIAPWNHQNAPLAPGTRVVVELPTSLADTAKREIAVINRELITWLSTRLPGDDCTLWQVN